jgi:LPXTG-motif cell wall-anchored protein
MKIRRRLGFLAIAVSALLAAGLLFSAPAFAWHADITDLHAVCPPGSDENQVEFVLELFEKGHTGHVEADYTIGGETTALPNKDLGPDDQSLSFEFSVPGPENDETAITVHTKTFFDDSEHTPESEASATLEKCQNQETTPTTTPTPSTEAQTPPVGAPAPAPSTEAPNTTAAAAKAESELPGTGSSNTLPMLIVGLVMLVGGGAALFTARIRGRHAK